MNQIEASFIKALEKTVYHHRDLYYNGVPVISDERYDELVSNLKRLKPDSDFFKK